jgi:small-conductance mechanosensitive channel
MLLSIILLHTYIYTYIHTYIHSLDFAEAFGAWARLLHRQKKERARREKKKAEQFGASQVTLVSFYAFILLYMCLLMSSSGHPRYIYYVSVF